MSAASQLRRALAGAACVAALTGPASAATAQTTSVTTTTPTADTATTGGAASTAPGATTTAPAITAADAQPGAVVDPVDRVEIAQGLAEATEDTGVCFGYELSISGVTTGPSSEQASNAGPDARPGPGPECPKGVVAARISLTYTSSSSEREDSASFSVASTVPGLTSTTVRHRLDDLGLLNEGAFLGDEDDLAVRNLAVALPLTLNDAAPAQEAAPAPAAPNGDRLTGSPGSDWMRAHLVTVLVAGFVLVVAVIVVAVAWLARRAAGSDRSRRPRGGSPSPPDSSPAPSSDPPSA